MCAWILTKSKKKSNYSIALSIENSIGMTKTRRGRDFLENVAMLEFLLAANNLFFFVARYFEEFM